MSSRQLFGENLLDGGAVCNDVSVEQDVCWRCVVEFGYGGFAPGERIVVGVYKVRCAWFLR